MCNLWVAGNSCSYHLCQEKSEHGSKVSVGNVFLGSCDMPSFPFSVFFFIVLFLDSTRLLIYAYILCFCLCICFLSFSVGFFPKTNKSISKKIIYHILKHTFMRNLFTQWRFLRYVEEAWGMIYFMENQHPLQRATEKVYEIVIIKGL